MQIDLTHPEVVLQGFLNRRLLLFGTLKNFGSNIFRPPTVKPGGLPKKSSSSISNGDGCGRGEEDLVRLGTWVSQTNAGLQWFGPLEPKSSIPKGRSEFLQI